VFFNKKFKKFNFFIVFNIIYNKYFMNNIKNKLISREKIESIVNSYMGDTPLRINNIKKFQKAFIHKSFCIVESDNSDSDNYCSIDYNENLKSSNERLEFLGDKVIDLITTEFLFDIYPDKNEGFLTKLKSRIVKKESLSYLSEKLGFHDLILISSHVERISGRQNPRFGEDLFESFIGILYKDQKSDLNICKKFLLNVYKKYINLDKIINNNDNYKDSLLRYFHSNGWGHPIYEVIKTEYNNSNKEFIVAVFIDQEYIKKINEKLLENILNEQYKYYKFISPDTRKNSNTCLLILGIGKGNTKKISEQECSKFCLDALKVSRNY